MTETSKETVLISDDIIKNKIYYIRNQRVMLDFELAEIYGYTTTRFNEQVKNNSEKFDDDFMFQLTKSEFDNLISKNRHQVGEDAESCPMRLQNRAFIC